MSNKSKTRAQQDPVEPEVETPTGPYVVWADRVAGGIGIQIEHGLDHAPEAAIPIVRGPASARAVDWDQRYVRILVDGAPRAVGALVLP